MDTNSVNNISVSSAARLEEAKDSAALTQKQVQQYLVVSNAISMLFDTKEGMVTKAAAKTSTNGTPELTAVAPVSDPTTLSAADADMQLSGLLAFIDRMMANINSTDPATKAAAQDAITWAKTKINALITSGKLDSDFLTIANSGVTAMSDSTKWSAFWSVGTKDAHGTIANIYDLIKKMDLTSLASTNNNDTLFSVIMLFTDWGQLKVGDKDLLGQISGLAENFFGYTSPTTTIAYPEYALFTAEYLCNQMTSGGLQDGDLTKIVSCLLDSGTTQANNPDLWAFFHGDGTTPDLSLDTIIQAVANTSSWPTNLYGDTSDIEIDAKTIWDSFLNAK